MEVKFELSEAKVLVLAEACMQQAHAYREAAVSGTSVGLRGFNTTLNRAKFLEAVASDLLEMLDYAPSKGQTLDEVQEQFIKDLELTWAEFKSDLLKVLIATRKELRALRYGGEDADYD